MNINAVSAARCTRLPRVDRERVLVGAGTFVAGAIPVVGSITNAGFGVLFGIGHHPDTTALCTGLGGALANVGATIAFCSGHPILGLLGCAISGATLFAIHQREDFP